MTKSWREPDTLTATSAGVRNAARALTELHRELLAAGIATLEAQQERKIPALEALHLATSDPSLEWLRPLSTLIAEVDAFLDAGPIAAEEAVAIAAEAEALLRADGGDNALAARLRGLMDHRVDIASAYAAVERALAPLHALSVETDAATTLHDAHRRAERRGRWRATPKS